MNTLKAMGLVEYDPEKGRYKVAAEIGTERTAERVTAMLKQIEGA
jgi:DNA-binding IclR family transcriptional regulator